MSANRNLEMHNLQVPDRSESGNDFKKGGLRAALFDSASAKAG
jgi:hypothetical protein